MRVLHASVFTTQEQTKVGILQEAGCDTDPVWTGVEKIKSLIPPTLKPRTLPPVASRCTD